MEYLQYHELDRKTVEDKFCFKPCYKWNTFNTFQIYLIQVSSLLSFKPCYKWNTFNTFTGTINEIVHFFVKF